MSRLSAFETAMGMRGYAGSRAQKENVIKRSALSKIKMTTGGEKRIHKVILDGIVMTWCGIGWVDSGKPSKEQRHMLPRVVD